MKLNISKREKEIKIKLQPTWINRKKIKLSELPSITELNQNSKSILNSKIIKNA